jgi:hypothetical protein
MVLIQTLGLLMLLAFCILGVATQLRDHLMGHAPGRLPFRTRTERIVWHLLTLLALNFYLTAAYGCVLVLIALREG